MVAIGDVISFNNPAYTSYIFYACVLSLKMLLMSALTGSTRFRKNAFVNPEDATTRNAKIRTHEDVERVRRAHLNDLENIPVFLFVCALYLLTSPSTYKAVMLMRVYTAARFLHTFVYAVCVLPQPSRALSWAAGYFITIYMAVMTIIQFSSSM